tara:strand:- start:293 stop:619 length:327 start_codon:yes stop_codon:yes gene_type:complete
MSDVSKDLKGLVLLQLMNEYEQFCIDEAAYHMDRAKEVLTEGLRDPKKYHDEAKAFYKILAKLFPLMILMQCNEPQPPDSETEESLPDTPSSDLSESDSFEPEDQLDH